MRVDWLSVYGALLATSLAILQFNQWSRANRALKVRWYGLDEGNGATVEGSITNVSSHWIFIEGIYLGSSFRPWIKPWQHRSYEGIGLRLNEHYPSEAHSSGLLKPGEMAEFSGAKIDLEKHGSIPPLLRGFARRNVIWIEHSADRRPFFEALP